MTEHDDKMPELLEAMREKFGERIKEYNYPPPIARTLGARIISFDAEAGALSSRFPVDKKFLNPYGTMQGGMIAAVIDNTVGPLSVIIAPPNVTRNLDVTYSHPVRPEMGYITVNAELVEIRGRRVFLKAEVRSPEGVRLARAKAEHWIVGEKG